MQFLCSRWYLSPVNSLPRLLIISRTSSLLKSVYPIIIVSLNLKFSSPNAISSFGFISNTPENANEWPPYAYSVVCVRGCVEFVVVVVVVFLFVSIINKRRSLWVFHHLFIFKKRNLYLYYRFVYRNDRRPVLGWTYIG